VATLARIAAVTVALLGAATIANGSPQGGVPVAAFVLAGFLLAFSWLAEKTRFGRQIYAVGGNAEAARRAGIDVTRVRITVFALSGLMASLGGLLAVSREGAATTQTGGGNLLLEVVAAAVIGGTSLFGGRGRVTAALLGALVIGSVSNGLDLIGQPADVNLMVEGAILLAAVSLDRMSHRGDVAQRGRR
jgi:D-xylose transport system permease protein